ncbi:MAG: ion transporter [Armatimonadota bacterium]
MSTLQTSRWQEYRIKAGDWIDAPRQQTIIIMVILLNALTLGLETVPGVMARFGHALHLLDHVILGIFVLEIVLKLQRHGWRFFASGWNLFDFVIVGISLLPASGVFSVFRTLRILRALRLLNKLRQLRHIVETMMRSLPGLGWVSLLLLLLFYIFGIIGTTLFGTAHPQYFGNMAVTIYSLFELMTLEGWNSMARDVMATHPHAYLFFVPFILLASYMLLNLVIGVIISNMEGLHQDGHTVEEEQPAAAEPDQRDLHAAIQALHEKIDRLENRLASVQEDREDAVPG